MSPENIISSIDLGISLATAVLAAIGVFTWRKQITWTKKFDTSEEAMALFFEAEDNIRMIRSPFGYSNEGANRKKSPDETPTESAILDSGYVHFHRYETVKERFHKLRAMKHRFMSVFGKETGVYFDELLIVVNTILSAADRSAQMQLHLEKNPSSRYSDKLTERIKKWDEEKWEDEGDEISVRVKTIIDKMEAVCKKK